MDFEMIEAHNAEDGSGIYVRRSDLPRIHSTEASEEVTLDWAEDGTLVGVEIVAIPMVKRPPE